MRAKDAKNSPSDLWAPRRCPSKTQITAARHLESGYLNSCPSCLRGKQKPRDIIHKAEEPYMTNSAPMAGQKRHVEFKAQI
jgi:hypothetical protein